jgi:hypothetical protein
MVMQTRLTVLFISTLPVLFISTLPVLLLSTFPVLFLHNQADGKDMREIYI